MADMYEYISNHDAAAKARLITQYQESDNIKKIVTIYAKQVQDVEDAIKELLDERSIDSAIGYQLDLLGTILDEPRVGLGDDDYRLLLKAKIAQNVSEGTPEDIIGIFRMLLRPDEIFYNEVHPAGFELTAIGSTLPLTSIDRIKDAINRCRPAGVKLVDIKTVNQPEFSFFDDPDPTGGGFRDLEILLEPITPAFDLGDEGDDPLLDPSLGDFNFPLLGKTFSTIDETDESDTLNPTAGFLAKII